MAKEKFYTLNNILSHNADYNIIYGERSNGKTTAVLRFALLHHINSDYVSQLAIIRRYEEDFRGIKGQQMFESIIKLGWVEEFTNGEYNSIYYFSQRWYLAKYSKTGEKVKQAEEPFALAFAISSEEHYKSTSYPNVDLILFDEFITRGYYLPEEFVKFQNLLSTIIRLRTNVKIFMCGNTINKYCVYFTEMGLKRIKKQKKGTIDIYRYGNSDLVVAVEFSDLPSKKKPSNKYFAFDNPKLNMITNGVWEMDIYPHLPCKYKPKDIIYKFYILFEEEMLQGNLITVNNELFIFIHRKTSPIKQDTEWLVYQQVTDYRWNYSTNLLKPKNKIEKLIATMFKNNKVFYQDNEVGEVVNNYLGWCKVEG